MANKMIETGGAKVFGEMADEFDDWTNLEALKGSKVIVNGFRLHESKYTPGKEAVTIDVTLHDLDDHYGWTTEGKAVLNALKTNSENCPFECVVETRVSKRNGKEYPVIIGA